MSALSLPGRIGIQTSAISAVCVKSGSITIILMPRCFIAASQFRTRAYEGARTFQLSIGSEAQKMKVFVFASVSAVESSGYIWPH